MDVIAESFASNSLLALKTSTGRCCDVLAQNWGVIGDPYLENDELEFCDVIWMNPVFRGIPNEATLASSGRAVPLYRVSSSSDHIVQLRKLNNICIVVILEKRLGFQSGFENRLQHPACLFLSELLATTRSFHENGLHRAS